MKKEISNQKVNESKCKVWTENKVLAYNPYRVFVEMSGEKKNIEFQTKFFAARRARKIAKVLGVKPDLSFTPVL